MEKLKIFLRGRGKKIPEGEEKAKRKLLGG